MNRQMGRYQSFVYVEVQSLGQGVHGFRGSTVQSSGITGYGAGVSVRA